MLSHSTSLALLTLLGFCLLTPAEAAPTIGQNGVIQSLTGRTCPDTSLARVVYQGYSASSSAHVLNFHYAFVHSNSMYAGSDTVQWSTVHPAFRAFPPSSPSPAPPHTLPLYRLGTVNLSDYIFKLGTLHPTTGAPIAPYVLGYETNIGLTAWVYSSPSECVGVVPLRGVRHTLVSDHYYTTDAEEHGALLGLGWDDEGVVGWVLPVQS